MIHLDVMVKFEALLRSLNRVGLLEASARAAGAAIPPITDDDGAPVLPAAPPSAPPAPALPRSPAPAVAPEPEPLDVPPSPRVARRPSAATGDAAEAVYRAVIGADEPVALREIETTTGLSKPRLYRALRRLLEEGRLYRGGPESSQHGRYAVTPEAADAAYRRAKP